MNQPQPGACRAQPTRMKPLQLFPAVAAVLLCLCASPVAARKAHAPGSPPGIQVEPGLWTTGHFSLHYPPSAGAEVGEYVRWLELIRGRAQDVLGYALPGPVDVRILDAEGYRAAGETGDPSAGAVVGGKILIAPNPSRLDAAATALTRLYTEIVVDAASQHRATTWLRRGIEGYLADGFTPSLPVIADAGSQKKLTPLGAGLADAATDPSAESAAGPSTPEGSSAPSAFPGGAGPPAIGDAEAVFAVYFLQEVAGETALSRILDQARKGKSWSDAIQYATNLKPTEFDTAWMGMAQADVRSFVFPGMHTGTWSTPARLVLGAPDRPAVGSQAKIRLAIGSYALRITDQVDALLVAGGDVTVQGTVTTRIGVIGGSLHLTPEARVSGQISVLGGKLIIDPGATVLGTAEVSANNWDPTLIRSDHASLQVTIDKPLSIDLKLPGRGYRTEEGPLTIPAGETRDVAVAIGGALNIEGSVTGRAAALGGDVHLSGPLPDALQVVIAGGALTAGGKMVDGVDPSHQVTQISHFQADFTAPVQAGADPVPVYLGVGDTTIPLGQTYDAILCVGGNCLIDGVVRGGLVMGGDAAALSGSIVSGPLWVFGGHVRADRGAQTAGLKPRGDASAP